MSEEVNKYNTGKIYKIWSPSCENLVYYGSTILNLSQRLAGHKSDYKMYKNGKNRCCSSFKIFDECGDYRIDLVELFPCNSKDELNSREGHYIRNNNCINKCIAGRTRKEYRDEHKEHKKQYREDNKEKIRDQIKQWYEDNKDQRNARRRELYAKNKNQSN